MQVRNTAKTRKEWFNIMEMAKVTSKGQITIPISIRRSLDIHEGDKLLFLERPNGFMMVNPSTYQEELDNELSTATPPAANEQDVPSSSSSAANERSAPAALSTAPNERSAPSAPSPAANERSVPSAPSPAEYSRSKQYIPPPGSADSGSGSGEYDVAALLNEIRSMGAKI